MKKLESLNITIFSFSTFNWYITFTNYNFNVNCLSVLFSYVNVDKIIKLLFNNIVENVCQ